MSTTKQGAQAKRRTLRGSSRKTATPKATGKHLKSEMIRVDRDFANMVRTIAREAGVSVTEVTRTMYLEAGGDLS